MNPEKRQIVGLGIVVAIYVLATLWVLLRVIPDRTDGRISIELAHWQIEGNVREAVQALLDRYEELNPDVQVKQIAIPGSVYKMWLRTRLAAGLGTDIVEFGVFMPGMKDITPRYFQPITRFVDQPNPYNAGTPLEGVPWRKTIRDGMRSVDGFHPDLNQFYSATIWLNSIRLFYNKSLLRELTGYDKPPSDFGEFRAMSERIRAAGNETGRSTVPIAGGRNNSASIMGFSFARLMTPLMYDLDRSHRMKVTQDDTAIGFLKGRWSFDQPEVQTGMAFIREIGGLMSPGFQQLSGDDALQQFSRGEAVMMGAGTWDAPSIRAVAPFEIGVTRLPFPGRDDPAYGHLVVGPVGDGRVNTGFPLYVNKQTPHLDQVIDLLQFMTSMEGSRIFSRISGTYPATVGVESTDLEPDSAPFFDGYATKGSLINPAGPEARRLWETNLYHLFGPYGSPERMADALREPFPQAVETDMSNELKLSVQQLRRLEPAIIARVVMEAEDDPGDSGGATETGQLQAGQNTYEIRTYELRDDLIAVGVQPYF